MTMDTAQQLTVVLNQLLPNNSAKAEELLSRISRLDERSQHMLLSILQSEQSQSYFDRDHYKQTFRDIAFFDYKKSTEFSALLGEIFGTVDYSKQLERRDYHITRHCSSEQIRAALDKEGYFIFPERLQENLLTTIIDGLSSCQYNLKLSHKLFNIESPNDLTKINDNTAWIFDQQQVIGIDAVQQLVMDPVLLETIQGFLGTQPIHVQANSWWSKAVRSDATSFDRNAQMFHQDKEFIKFLKMFIYLNDVGEDNGPHGYIAGSNKDYVDRVPKDYQFSQRLSDDYLHSVYPKERFRSFSGLKGTVIIEDTSGFHKGTPVVEGYRQLLQLEFVSSLYFNPVTSFTPQGLTAEYQKFLQNNPRFASNYNQERYARDLRTSHATRRKYLLTNARSKIGKLLGRGSKS